MPALYRAMDLFVLPSFYDACSNAVLEALACGLKVLSTTANGSSVFLPQEHVTPDPGDAEDLAARIKVLIDEPAPGPFRIPDHIQAGLDTWVQVVNEECDQRTGKSGGMRETGRNPILHLPKIFDWRGGRAEGAPPGGKRRILKKRA